MRERVRNNQIKKKMNLFEFDLFNAIMSQNILEGNGSSGYTY